LIGMSEAAAAIMPGQLLALARNWWLFVLRGVAALLFGILTLVWPDITVAALVILFGAYAIVEGLASLMSAARHRDDRAHRGLHVLEGLLALAAGILTFIWPDVTALGLILLIGIWAVMSGIAEIVAAIQLRRVIEGEWLLALAGVLSVLAGIVILVRPGAGALGIALVIGVYAVVFGVSLIGLGLRLRRLSRMVAETPEVRPAA
jgi:uncharacterized membrane protein HdeD (DUF308 family)